MTLLSLVALGCGPASNGGVGGGSNAGGGTGGGTTGSGGGTTATGGGTTGSGGGTATGGGTTGSGGGTTATGGGTTGTGGGTGGGTTGTGGGMADGGSLTVLGVCTDLWTRRCHEWHQCLPDSFKAEFVDEADCTTQKANVCRNQYTGAAVRATPADLKRCFDGDMTLTCTQFERFYADPNHDPNTTNSDPSCALIPAGATQDGGTCAFNAECAGKTCIRSGECGLCSTRQPLGGPCSVNEHCAPGLSCGAQHQCTALVDLGGDCSIADCHTNLLCVRTVPDAGTSDGGLQSICVNRPARGDPCNTSDTNIKCRFFAGEVCDLATATCQPHAVSGLGGSCLLPLNISGKAAFREFCAPGFKCAQDSQRAVCAPVRHTGEGAFFTRGPDGAQCALGFKNINNGECVDDTTAACVGYTPPTVPTGPNPVKLPTFANLGGVLKKNYRVVPVTFSKAFDPVADAGVPVDGGSPYRAHVAALVPYLFSSGWYATAGAPWSVGAGSAATPVELDELPPNTRGSLTNLDLQDFLVAEITAGKLPMPQPFRTNQATMFMVFLPRSLTVGGLPYGTTCVNTQAYHDVVAAPFEFDYALVADCGAASGLTAVELLDIAAGHELIEGATNAINFSPTFQLARPNPRAYNGAEVTDVCQGQYIDQGGYKLPRSWSNAEAVAGRDPCIPVPPGSGPYYNVVPAVTNQVADAGTTATITLTGYTTGARPDWVLSARTLSAPTGFTGASLSAGTINDGLTSTLSVPVPANAAAGSVIAIGVRSAEDGGAPYDYRYQMVTVTAK